jgi:hypothetical protein
MLINSLFEDIFKSLSKNKLGCMPLQKLSDAEMKILCMLHFLSKSPKTRWGFISKNAVVLLVRSHRGT